MSLVFVQLRWDAVDAARFDEICRTVPQGDDLPPGCLSRNLRRQGNVLTGAETWDTETAGGRMDQLITAVRAAGVARAPQTAMFAVPEPFAVAYRRPAAPAPATAGEAAAPLPVPQQRGADVRERLEEGSAAVHG